MAQPAAAPDTGFPGTNNALAGERMKGQTWDTRRSPSTPRCRRGRRGRLSRCSSRCRASERELGCQWLPARPTTGRRGAAAAAAQRLSSAGRRRGNRITKMIRPKKSHMSLHFSLSRRPPRSWDWVFPLALPPFYVAYLFSPCFGLSSCVFP